MLRYLHHDTPIGPLLLAGDGASLKVIDFPKGKGRREAQEGWIEDAAPFDETRRQLDAYFAGRLQRFSLTLAPEGTAFQQSVWQALQEIPYGTTWSYGALAAHIGRPKASRAVGAANGANPIPIVIPCHRVIGSNGTLTGFGGGLDLKEALLSLEGVRPAAQQPSLFDAAGA